MRADRLIIFRGIYALVVSIILFCYFYSTATAQHKNSKFRVIAFYTAKNDLAHISFVHEANKWFSEISNKYHFTYDSTDNWNNLNKNFLSNYHVIIFLDTRPDSASQRQAFQTYMENGGAWMGFHFSGFALTPSEYPQNWDWYHNEFLGGGQYKGNSWRPVSAILRVEDPKHPVTGNLPGTFKSAPSEWYSWEKDIRENEDIKILISIDSSSFPLGTGPKLHEIWHSGYYPVAWTNTRYRMIYMNMGHNDMDYERRINPDKNEPVKELSSSFSSEFQNQFIVNSLLWLGNGKKKDK